MPAPIRNIGQAPSGFVQGTPKRILNRLAIRALKVTGVKGARSGRR